jgi:sodium transport system permease protein
MQASAATGEGTTLMSWSNVRLIFLREARDQLRDRRTLFTIAILPLLLYPLLGMAVLQVSQFTREQPASVWIAGAEQLPASPHLLQEQRFHPDVCPPEEARLLELQVNADIPDDLESAAFTTRVREQISRGNPAVVVVFPTGFAATLQESAAVAPTKDGEQPPLVQPRVFFDAANDRSRIAAARVGRVLDDWRQVIVREQLAARQISPRITHPFTITEVDVSQAASRRAAFWSKILPFIVFLWALTGAFYPAVDLCAGEKERGTLETLLISPAERSEIVMGKLLTVMGFSVATSLLNLVSMTVTGTTVILMQPAVFPSGPPPLAALGWLVLALLPISALFSASALAIAAFARSTKEGQYYLMPLLMISLPLMILPMMPSVGLNWGTSLIPITGMLLLLRAAVEGQYAEAILFAPSVLMVTFLCCLLTVRWAIDQFNNESVLFRESERLDLGLWLRRQVLERRLTPTVGQAFACGVLLLAIRFFATFAATPPTTWSQFVVMQSVTLIVLLAGPALLMTFLLTRGPRETLSLRRPTMFSVPLAVLLALAMHPAAMWVATGIQYLYPVDERMAGQLQQIQSLIASAPSKWYVLAVLAVMPAVCEELAFRGFILSGFRHMGSRWRAIVISSLFFGLTHGILQQSISATLVGMVLAYIVVQTGSLWTSVAFHFVYNSLGLAAFFLAPDVSDGAHWWNWFGELKGGGFEYHWPAAVVGILLSVAILWWFHRQPRDLSPEERFSEVLHHPTSQVSTG